MTGEGHLGLEGGVGAGGFGRTMKAAVKSLVFSLLLRILSRGPTESNFDFLKDHSGCWRDKRRESVRREGRA